jgi:hypothetical protein
MDGAASYNVYRRVGAAPFAPIAIGHRTDYATYPDSGLTNGVTYTYAVTWVNGKVASRLCRTKRARRRC